MSPDFHRGQVAIPVVGAATQQRGQDPTTLKFSVVTISFNQGQYLEETLNSVLGQDHPQLEYIVVDPGSTDGSRELIARYSDRLAKIVFEPDDGAADGLNNGFRHATGSVYGFLNSDDVLLPGALEAVGQVFEQDSSCGIVMGNGFLVDSSGKRIRHVRAAGFTPERYFYGGATWLQQATFFRREAFEEVGGFNRINRSCWDGELVLEMARSGAKIVYIDHDLALFRVHPQSITGSKRHKEMMKADAERMFLTARGRRWTALDTARSWACRAERILTQRGALKSAIRARLYGT